LSRLPVISGREMVRLLSKIGFAIVGRKGSHVRLKRRRGKEILIVIVPMHHELARGTLRSILRQANLTVDDLLRLL
jgi:predicted RNA binding protein YcfA (HicA-like mRNA interferase family)